MRLKERTNEFCKLLSTVKAFDRRGNEIGTEEAFERSVNMLKEAGRSAKKVSVIGNGGSAAIASHVNADLLRSAGIRTASFNDPALLTCMSNDLGYEKVFEYPVKKLMDIGDVMIAVSSSGMSANILNGAHAAKGIGCAVITLSGFNKDNKLSSIGDVNFYVPSEDYGLVESAHQFILQTIVGAVGS